MKAFTKTIAIGALVASSMLVASSAFADDVVQTVTAGERSASVADPTLGAVDTSHSATDSVGSATLAVDDLSGSGAGWAVTQKISDFESTAGTTDIPAAGFTVEVGTIASVEGQPASDVTGTDAAVALDSEQVVLSAPAGSGMGSYTADLALGLSVPADTYAGAYTGTLTTTIAAAPVD